MKIKALMAMIHGEVIELVFPVLANGGRAPQ
jgi:hypothetical protein